MDVALSFFTPPQRHRRLGRQRSDTGLARSQDARNVRGIMRPIIAILCFALALSAQHLNYPLPPAHTGRIYLSEWSDHRVSEHLPDGTFLRDFKHPSMLRPRGVAVDELGRLIVVTGQSTKILIFELDGSLARSVTHLDLSSGTGISRSPSGEWYVGNFNPGRVVVFGPDWTYRRSITLTGMNGVNCVSFDANGDYAVSAAFANRIYRFDKSDTAIGNLTHTSMGSPMSIASDSTGNHYLSNGSGLVTKFDAAWNQLSVFGTGFVAAPQGIIIDENDELTITSFSSSIVHRFDTNGQHLSSFPLRNSVIARNLSYQTSPYILARRGSVNGNAREPVLSVRGQQEDQLGRVSISGTAPLYVDLAASSKGPNPATYLLIIDAGTPSLAKIWDLPLGTGLFAISPTWVFPGGTAPSAPISLPNGAGVTGILSLQAILLDNGASSALSASPSNALIINFL